ncbi:MAG: hypothetical protein V2A34_02465 [Lentisphaerota bacterium]
MDDLLSAITPVTRMHENVKARLKAHAFFADIPVLIYNQQDLDSEIDKALATITGEGGHAGACVLILPAKYAATHPDMEGPYFDNTEMVIRSCVNQLINNGDDGTKKQAVLIALMVAALLHHYREPGINECFISESVLPFQDSELDIWDTKIKTELGLKPIYS